MVVSLDVVAVVVVVSTRGLSTSSQEIREEGMSIGVVLLIIE